MGRQRNFLRMRYPSFQIYHQIDCITPDGNCSFHGIFRCSPPRRLLHRLLLRRYPSRLATTICHVQDYCTFFPDKSHIIFFYELGRQFGDALHCAEDVSAVGDPLDSSRHTIKSVAVADEEPSLVNAADTIGEGHNLRVVGRHDQGLACFSCQF